MAESGSLSSLGIGSGVLTYDVIEKLKKADESMMITPFKNRLESIQEKETQLDALITQISLFKTTIADFKDGNIFQTRTTDINGDSVDVKVNSGVSTQNVSIDVTQLAQNDIYQSKGYNSENSTINNTGSTQTITLEYAGAKTNIELEDGASLNDLKTAINDANIGVTASIIDTGSDTNPYKLILKGDKTGKNNIIKLDYHSIDDLNFNDINYQSKEYSSNEDSVTSTDTTFKVTINGQEHSISVSANTKVKDFIDQINNQLGGDGINATYNSNTNKIELDIDAIGDIVIDEGDLNTSFNSNTTNGQNRLQAAQNSLFKYNGVDIERDSNEIDDILIGATFTLKDSGKTTINIKQDSEAIKEAVGDFVNSYNSIVSKIQDLTKYDEESGDIGVFQNESVISSIPKDISGLLFNSFTTDTITKLDRNSQEYNETILLNATDFGFSMNRTGFLDFDSLKFADMLKNEPEKVEEFLSGENGAFSKILEYVDSLTKGENSSLELLSTQYSNEEKSYEKTIENTQDMIDTKYQIMAMQFASYDEMINSYNVQAQTIQQAIEAMINAK
jgi:flagellar hook-associated protein 2